MRNEITVKCIFLFEKVIVCVIIIIYSVSHIITYPSKELCSKLALGEVGMSLP